MLKILEQIEQRVGNTPLIQLRSIEGLYAKLEAYQYANSIKIRPAIFILKEAIQKGMLQKDTVIIESTSGNFGVALAMLTKSLGLSFIAVIDKNTPKDKRQMLELLSTEVVIITEKDKCGGYLLNRIKYIEDFKAKHPNCFHPNQYLNQGNPQSYFSGLGEEICNDFDKLDMIFVAVSTGGTIAGLSKRLKQKFPDIKVVAVDVQGSQIFQKIPHNRKLSGLGSSIESCHIKRANIDKVEILTEAEITKGGQELVAKEMILGGPSTGAAYFVASQYMKKYPGKIGLFICPDEDISYLRTMNN